MYGLYEKVTTKTERAIQELFNTFTLDIICSFKIQMPRSFCSKTSKVAFNGLILLLIIIIKAEKKKTNRS